MADRDMHGGRGLRHRARGHGAVGESCVGGCGAAGPHPAHSASCSRADGGTDDVSPPRRHTVLHRRAGKHHLPGAWPLPLAVRGDEQPAGARGVQDVADRHAVYGRGTGAQSGAPSGGYLRRRVGGRARHQRGAGTGRIHQPGRGAQPEPRPNSLYGARAVAPDDRLHQQNGGLRARAVLAGHRGAGAAAGVARGQDGAAGFLRPEQHGHRQPPAVHELDDRQQRRVGLRRRHARLHLRRDCGVRRQELVRALRPCHHADGGQWHQLRLEPEARQRPEHGSRVAAWTAGDSAAARAQGNNAPARLRQPWQHGRLPAAEH